MLPPRGLIAALLALFAALLLGCGSDERGGSAGKADSRPLHPYLREMKAAAPPEDSAATRLLNRTTEAGEYRRAAVALEGVIPELRAYVRRLEDVDPPPACARFHRQLERVQRAGIRLYAGALPLYRTGDEELVRTFMLRAAKILDPIIAPVLALDGADRLPCLAK